jgi:molybdopterin converting factor small subunit
MLAGKSTLSLEMESGQSILDAFLVVLQKVPALSPHWLGQDGLPQVSVHVFVNGNDAMTLTEGLNTPLNDGDCLDFVPPVAGG